MREAVAQGNLGGEGVFSVKCCDFLRDYLQSTEVLLTSSCTAALEIAVQTAGIGLGDEVIVPSFTYVSTANAIIRQGAVPVWVDIRPDTLCMDESLVARAVTAKTRAILPVHYGGIPCEMAALRQMAAQHNLAIIEDAAAALGSQHRGQAVGAWGDFACFSFHETKNVSCGQGGVLCINKPELADQARIIRDRGTNRHLFMKGEVDQYAWVGRGSAYGLSELAAAFLWGQLEMIDSIGSRREQQFLRYHEALSPLVDQQMIRLPSCRAESVCNHHTFALITRSAGERDRLLAHLRSHGILAAPHYVPLHTSPMGRTVVGPVPHLPVTESISGLLVRLPLFHSLGESEQDEVIDAVLAFYPDTMPLSASLAATT